VFINMSAVACTVPYCKFTNIPEETKESIKANFYALYDSPTCAKDQQVFLMKFILCNSKGRKHYKIEDYTVCRSCLCKFMRIGSEKFNRYVRGDNLLPSKQGKFSKRGKKRKGVSQDVIDQVNAFTENEEKITEVDNVTSKKAQQQVIDDLCKKINSELKELIDHMISNDFNFTVLPPPIKPPKKVRSRLPAKITTTEDSTF